MAEQTKTKVRVIDKRKSAKETANFSGEYDIARIERLIRAAIKHKEDPATVIAKAIQESTLGTRTIPGRDPKNILGLNFSEEEKVLSQTYDEEKFIDRGLEHWKFMRGIADRKEKDFTKRGEAEYIQPYNRAGALEYSTVDWRTAPYGKRILDVRENIVKQSPEVMEIIRRMTAPQEDKQAKPEPEPEPEFKSYPFKLKFGKE